MSKGVRYPAALAGEVYRELEVALSGSVARMVAAGSLRRGKPDVGDLEVLFLPCLGERAVGLFGEKALVDMSELAIGALLADGVLAKRVGEAGGTAWGPKNKLAVHVRTGLPVDLFAATEANWFNYLVCRTGPAESNMKIASKAKGEGWKWQPYEAGFLRSDGVMFPMRSEAEVFRFVGLPVPAWCEAVGGKKGEAGDE